MSLHSRYMIAISILVLLVFAVLLHSLIRHHRINHRGPPRFLGVTGTIQWIWTLIPLLILTFVGSGLVEREARQPAMASGADKLAQSPKGDNSPAPTREQASGTLGTQDAGKVRVVYTSHRLTALR